MSLRSPRFASAVIKLSRAAFPPREPVTVGLAIGVLEKNPIDWPERPILTDVAAMVPMLIIAAASSVHDVAPPVMVLAAPAVIDNPSTVLGE